MRKRFFHLDKRVRRVQTKGMRVGEGVHTLTLLNLYRRNFHISTAQTARLLKEYRVKYDLYTVAKIYTHTQQTTLVCLGYLVQCYWFAEIIKSAVKTNTLPTV